MPKTINLKPFLGTLTGPWLDPKAWRAGRLHRNLRQGLTLVVGALLPTLLAGCADVGYYLQSARGHWGVMQAARPVGDWLAEPQATPALKRQLELAQRIRRFAVTELALPDNPSYTRYADLHRTAVVWNVVAAPELSLTLQTWCFPVAGCVGYRGYFDESQAREFAAGQQATGLEVGVYGVPAYSTLGWMNWAGGDPLLNTFINYPEAEMARLIFHELAHQVAYAKDDTTFNESFATAVERLGGDLWLAQPASAGARRQHEANSERRAQFRALTQATRQNLAKIYGANDPNDSNDPSSHEKTEKLALKKVAMEEFRASYARLRSAWVAGSAVPQNFSGYDAWVARANNASFGAQASYDELVPQFEALYRQTAEQTARQSASQGQPPWPAFYDAVKRLALLPREERRRLLAEQAGSAASPLHHTPAHQTSANR